MLKPVKGIALFLIILSVFIGSVSASNTVISEQSDWQSGTATFENMTVVSNDLTISSGKSGRYNSTTYDLGETRYWSSLYTKSTMNGESGNIKVQLSPQSGFPSGQTKSFLFSMSDGINTYDLKGAEARYMRLIVNVTSNSNKPVVEWLNLTHGGCGYMGELPVACWPMNEGTGQDVADVAIPQNDGFRGQDGSSEPMYDPEWLTSGNCVEGNCLDFVQDGKNDGEFVSVAPSGSLNTSELTLAAWVYPTAYTGDADNAIIAKEESYKIALGDGNGAGEDAGELVGAIFSNSCGWCGEDAGGWQQSNVVIPQNTWTHVAMTWNRTHFRFYVDGNKVYDQTTSKISGPTDAKHTNYYLAIGGRDPLAQTVQGPFYLFDGRIDNPLVFGKALNDTVIDKIYRGHANPPTISSPTPIDDGYSNSDPTRVSVQVADPENQVMTATVKDESGAVLNSTTISGSGKLIADYPGLTNGEDYTWSVNASDGTGFTYREFNFTYRYIPFTRSKFETAEDKTAIIITEDSEDLISLSIDNPSSSSKNMRTTIDSTIDVQFVDGSMQKAYTLSPGETKNFLVKVKPDKLGKTNLNVSTRNMDLGITTDQQFEIFITSAPKGEPYRLPGIGLIQLMALLAGSTVLYFLLL